LPLTKVLEALGLLLRNVPVTRLEREAVALSIFVAVTLEDRLRVSRLTEPVLVAVPDGDEVLDLLVAESVTVA
jgi:hypothetical protein